MIDVHGRRGFESHQAGGLEEALDPILAAVLDRLIIIPTFESEHSISRLIKEAVNQKYIKPFDPTTAPRYMKYVPTWA